MQSCGRKVGHFINLFVSTTTEYTIDDFYSSLPESRYRRQLSIIVGSRYIEPSLSWILIFVYSFPHRVFSRFPRIGKIFYTHGNTKPIEIDLPMTDFFFQIFFKISEFFRNCPTTIINFPKISKFENSSTVDKFFKFSSKVFYLIVKKFVYSEL